MTAVLPLTMSSYGVAKRGSTDLEWEDAASHSESRRCFALSDGAASAYQAGLWSHLLTSGFVQSPPNLEDDQTIADWIQERAKAWDASTAPDGDAPYYVQLAQERGSHATLLAVQFDSANQFTAVAVGDSCLFGVSNGRITRSFPIEDPEHFTFHPELVATTPASATGLRRIRGQVREGDVLIAATDALAEYLLRSCVDGDHAPVQALLDPAPAFDAVVADARQSGQLRNDDVAMIRCQAGVPA